MPGCFFVETAAGSSEMFAGTQPAGFRQHAAGVTPRDGVYLRLLGSWVDAALRHSSVKALGPGEFVSAVAGVQGAVGYGESEVEAVDSLRFGLADWLHLSLVDGDDDIPVFAGLDFNLR